MNKARDRQAPTEKGTANSTRFRQARAVFEAALDKRSDERDRYVESACVGDEALLRDVKGMLAADQHSESLLKARHGSSDSNVSSAPEEGRFAAGTVLAGRYRILGLLGKGGMGEVYRAFDIILNQTVALKFLTESRWTEAALIRFRNEVRIARQVSHPNVCRVYDLGMVDGLNFLSMEYIDGEDLAALLRRIGRLPEDKAMEFTRKICAGLAAAHERGILHRDLKPANIMIDGRGQVRITDFGLAGLIEEIPLSDLGSGTPAYMAPEQKAGKEVSVRSDIYSLGMILHEMFTGHSRDHASESHPTDYVKDLDPQIERVILQCLAEDPRLRPSSALRVAMSLPGGNAIAAALAAGETPSPEAVAASEEKEGFEIRTALICMGLVVLCFLGSLAWGDRFGFLARAPLELDPATMDFQARSLLEDLGYTDVPADVASGWLCCDLSARLQIEEADSADREAMLASHRPALIQYVYRQHRDRFRLGPVSYDDPPNVEPGMIQLRLDARGRLLELEAEPWTEDADRGSSVEPATIDLIFAAAGLDRARFTAVSPERLPSTMADTRLAWTGTADDGAGSAEVRLESAFWQGRPVNFMQKGAAGSEGFTMVDPSFVPYAAALVVALLGAALLLLWHRSRGNRLDRRGAFALTSTLLLIWLIADIWTGFFFTSGGIEIVIWLILVWLIYISVEPLVRRYWPDSLISWTRLTRGRFRNPLVASHILVGVLACEVFALVGRATLAVSNPVPGFGSIQFAMTGDIGSVPVFLNWAGQGVVTALGFLALVVIARLIIRNTWVADILAVAIISLGSVLSLIDPGIDDIGSVVIIVSYLVMIALMRRFGFLALLTAFVFLQAIVNTPDPTGGWMAGRLIVLHAIPVVVALWSLWVILTSRNRSGLELAA